MGTTRKSSATLVIAFLTLIIGALLLLSLLNLAFNLPDMSPHAWEKHQTQAQIAYNYVNSLPSPDHCKWSCNDGRDRFVCRMPSGEWAIVVMAKDIVITAFIADQDYAKSIIDTPGCSNPWQYSHP